MDFKSINLAVAEQLIQTGSKKALDHVISKFVESEVQKRASALFEAIKLYEKTEKEVKQFKPDVNYYNEDGTAMQPAWSKQKLDQRKNTEEKLQKINNAIVKATDKNEWNDLFNLTKNNETMVSEDANKRDSKPDTKSNG